MSNIPIQTNILGNNYKTVIDTDFKTFIKPQISDNSEITIDKFFENYDKLFYQIPKEGNINSHNYILNKTLEYLELKLSDDESIQVLLDEITNLRQNLLEDSKLINEITNAN